MAMMGCTHDRLVLDSDVNLEDLLEEGIPLDLGRLPALRHFIFRVQISALENVTLLDLNQLLSTSTSSSGIETLEIDITYDCLCWMWKGFVFI